MNGLSNNKIEGLKKLGQKYLFNKIWVFGSVLRQDFTQDSDVDLLYQLDHEAIEGEASLDYFFGFIDEAKKLLGHPIDMIWYPGIRNPFFKQEVDATKVLIYDAAAVKVSV